MPIVLRLHEKPMNTRRWEDVHAFLDRNEAGTGL